MSEEKKGAERLDFTSTDAMHWAECFCEQVKINSNDEVHIEPDFLVGYFANFWAAVYDPLQNTIESQAAELSELRERVRELEDAIRKEFPEPDMNAHDGPCCSGFEGGRWVSTGCDCVNPGDTAAASEWRRDANLHLKFKALLSTRREEG